MKISILEQGNACYNDELIVFKMKESDLSL